MNRFRCQNLKKHNMLNHNNHPGFSKGLPRKLISGGPEYFMFVFYKFYFLKLQKSI